MAISDNQSRAREFYEEIIGHHNPASFLQDLIAQRKPENDFLEFKGASNLSDKHAKGLWSKALSGFANTEGGVLIWGIRATRVKSPDDPSKSVDVATEPDLVPHPEIFVQLLKDVRLEATVDPVQGVELQHCPAGNGTEEGFVVCLIPEGSHKPYRAALADEKQYYQRVGDNFIIIPHSLLRSLFYPQTAPDLVLEIEAGERTAIDSTNDPPEWKSRYTFEARISNFGTASGENIFVRVKPNYPAQWDVGGCFGRRASDFRDGAFLAQRPLHPDEQSVHCFSCNFTAPTHLDFQSGRPGIPLHSKRPEILHPDQIVFDVAVYARDAAPVQARLVFHSHDVDNRSKMSTRTATTVDTAANSP
jgi:hypothetical protein